MLQIKSKPKDIEYYIQQVEMLSMSEEEMSKVSKVMALKELISDESIQELIAEDLKDDTWVDATNILISICNKRQIKSEVLQEHIKQCKNFMVFRYIEDKLLGVKEIVVSKINWEFKEVDMSGKQSQWVNFKFNKVFEESDLKTIFGNLSEVENITIDSEWLYKNKNKIYSSDIFEDIDFLIKKKRKEK